MSSRDIMKSEKVEMLLLLQPLTIIMVNMAMGVAMMTKMMMMMKDIVFFTDFDALSGCRCSFNYFCGFIVALTVHCLKPL